MKERHTHKLNEGGVTVIGEDTKPAKQKKQPITEQPKTDEVKDHAGTP